MMVETVRQHEISSVEFSSTRLEPTGKSEFSKSARFGCERAEHFGIGAPKIFITSHGELIAPKGISMCSPAPVRPTDEISSFPASWRNAKYFDISAFLRWHFYRPAFLLYAILGFRNTLKMTNRMCRHFSTTFLFAHTCHQMSPFVAFALIQWLRKVFAHCSIYDNIHKY